MRLHPSYRFAPDDAGKGASSGSTEEQKKDESKKEAKEVKELDKTIEAVEKKIEKKGEELERMSESTGHAVLEQLKVLNEKLDKMKKRRSFLMF